MSSEEFLNLLQEFQKQKISQIIEEIILIFQQVKHQESDQIKSYSLQWLLDILLLYKTCNPFICRIFQEIQYTFQKLVSSTNQQENRNYYFNYLQQLAEFIQRAILLIQRIFGTFQLISTDKEFKCSQLLLNVNTKKLEIQKNYLSFQNERLQKWKQYESYKFVNKHFQVRGNEEKDLRKQLDIFEEQEKRILQNIKICEDNFSFLNIPFLEIHKKFFFMYQELYKIMHKLAVQLSESNLSFFIEQDQIKQWINNSEIIIKLCQDDFGVYNQMLQQFQRIEFEVLKDKELIKLWEEIKLQQKGRKLFVNEIRSIMQYSLSSFQEECRSVLEMLEVHSLYKKPKVFVK